jgi:hypothetical protein
MELSPVLAISSWKVSTFTESAKRCSSDSKAKAELRINRRRAGFFTRNDLREFHDMMAAPDPEMGRSLQHPLNERGQNTPKGALVRATFNNCRVFRGL